MAEAAAAERSLSWNCAFRSAESRRPVSKPTDKGVLFPRRGPTARRGTAARARPQHGAAAPRPGSRGREGRAAAAGSGTRSRWSRPPLPGPSRAGPTDRPRRPHRWASRWRSGESWPSTGPPFGPARARSETYGRAQHSYSDRRSPGAQTLRQNGGGGAGSGGLAPRAGVGGHRPAFRASGPPRSVRGSPRALRFHRPLGLRSAPSPLPLWPGSFGSRTALALAALLGSTLRPAEASTLS